MRIESVSLRLLLLAALLAVVAVLCAGALVFAGVLHLNGGRVLGAGGALLLVAMLAAAMSALGPKYRPTPFLTPMAAGAFAAVLATTAVYAAHVRTVEPKARATTAVANIDANKPKPPASRPVKTAPVMAKAEPEPMQPQKEVRMLNAGFDSAAFDPAPVHSEAMASPAAPRPAAPAQPTAAMPAMAAEPPVPAESEVAALPDTTQAKPAHKPAKAGTSATIPLPEVAPSPAEPGAPINLQVTFDPTGPVAAKVSAPLALADGAKPASPAIPPRPRIRPCGGAGPACP